MEAAPRMSAGETFAVLASAAAISTSLGVISGIAYNRPGAAICTSDLAFNEIAGCSTQFRICSRTSAGTEANRNPPVFLLVLFQAS